MLLYLKTPQNLCRLSAHPRARRSVNRESGAFEMCQTQTPRSSTEIGFNDPSQSESPEAAHASARTHSGQQPSTSPLFTDAQACTRSSVQVLAPHTPDTHCAALSTLHHAPQLPMPGCRGAPTSRSHVKPSTVNPPTPRPLNAPPPLHRRCRRAHTSGVMCRARRRRRVRAVACWPLPSKLVHVAVLRARSWRLAEERARPRLPSIRPRMRMKWQPLPRLMLTQPGRPPTQHSHPTARRSVCVCVLLCLSCSLSLCLSLSPSHCLLEGISCLDPKHPPCQHLAARRSTLRTRTYRERQGKRTLQAGGAKTSNKHLTLTRSREREGGRQRERGQVIEQAPNANQLCQTLTSPLTPHPSPLTLSDVPSNGKQVHQLVIAAKMMPASGPSGVTASSSRGWSGDKPLGMWRTHARDAVPAAPEGERWVGGAAGGGASGGGGDAVGHENGGKGVKEEVVSLVLVVLEPATVGGNAQRRRGAPGTNIPGDGKYEVVKQVPKPSTLDSKPEARARRRIHRWGDQQDIYRRHE
jgi:hypothetical protein